MSGRKKKPSVKQRTLNFSSLAWDDYLYWYNTDKEKITRIHALISDILRDPFRGIGKPESLKFEYSGYWSRRIDNEHRLVYKATADAIIIAQCRYHY
jgi:toxin YoeB